MSKKDDIHKDLVTSNQSLIADRVELNLKIARLTSELRSLEETNRSLSRQLEDEKSKVSLTNYVKTQLQQAAQGLQSLGF